VSSCWGDNLQAWYDFDNDTRNIAQRTADILAQNTVDYGTWNHVVITRETTIHGNWDEPAITPNFGVDEAAQYIIDEMGGEMIYVYNLGNGSAQDAADLVEYLNCEVGENPNGDNYAKMYAEGAVRTFTKEKVAEFDNWDTTSDKSKASHYSDGTPNQVKHMRYANDVTQHEDKAKMVQPDSVHVYVNDQEWTIGEDLTAASSTASPSTPIPEPTDRFRTAIPSSMRRCWPLWTAASSPRSTAARASWTRIGRMAAKNVCISEYGIFNHSGDVVQSQTPEGVPPTGDSAQLMWYGAALAAAAFLLSGVAFVRKRRR